MLTLSLSLSLNPVLWHQSTRIRYCNLLDVDQVETNIRQYKSIFSIFDPKLTIYQQIDRKKTRRDVPN